MTTSVTADYSEYVGKRVIITTAGDDGTDIEVQGTVELANELGVLFKPRGLTTFVRYGGEGDKPVIQMVLAPETSKKIKAKTIKPVALGQARSHLLERHGATLTDVNALTEEQAFEAHLEIDHVASDLGHVHGEAKADKAE